MLQMEYYLTLSLFGNFSSYCVINNYSMSGLEARMVTQDCL